MKNAIATFQTISAMVVAIAAPVSPGMLMKTTLAMTLTAALRDQQVGCGVFMFGHRHDGQLRPVDPRDEHCSPTVGATRIHGVAKGITQCDLISQALSVCRHMANAARVVRLLIESF